MVNGCYNQWNSTLSFVSADLSLSVSSQPYDLVWPYSTHWLLWVNDCRACVAWPWPPVILLSLHQFNLFSVFWKKKNKNLRSVSYIISTILLYLLASSAIDSGYKPRSGQTKHYQIDFCCLSLVDSESGYCVRVKRHVKNCLPEDSYVSELAL